MVKVLLQYIKNFITRYKKSVVIKYCNFRSLMYRGGLLRSAFLKVMRTIWECTPKIKRDHMGVHSWYRKGPNGSALLKVKGTTWECTRISKRPNGSALIIFDRDHIDLIGTLRISYHVFMNTVYLLITVNEYSYYLISKIWISHAQ